MRKRSLIATTVTITTMMLMSSVGCRFDGNITPLGSTQVYASEVVQQDDDRGIIPPTLDTSQVYTSEVVQDDDRGIIPPPALDTSQVDSSSQNVEEPTGTPPNDASQNTNTNTNNTSSVVVKKAPTIKVSKTKFTIKYKKGLTKTQVVKSIKRSITAKDADGKSLKSKVQVKKPSFSSKKYNKYQKLTVTVKDDYGNVSTKTIKLKLTKFTSVKKYKKLTKSSALYKKASTSKGKKIKSIKKGTKVYIISKLPNTGWYKVKTKGKVGYMKASKFKVVKKSTSPNYTPAPAGKKVYISERSYILNGYVYIDGFSRPVMTEEEWYSLDDNAVKHDKELTEGDWGPSWAGGNN